MTYKFLQSIIIKRKKPTNLWLIKFFSTIIIIAVLLFQIPLKSRAGILEDSFKNAVQIIKSIISDKNQNNNEEENANYDYRPLPPTPWLEFANIVDLIKKEHLQLKNEFLPMKFIRKQKISDFAELFNQFLKLDLMNATATIIIEQGITPKELEEWQIRQNIIRRIDQELGWYEKKLKEGFEIESRYDLENLILNVQKHWQMFKKETVAPARIIILINSADDAITIAKNRGIIIKSSIAKLSKYSLDRRQAEKIYSSAQDKIKLADIKIQIVHQKNQNKSPEKIELLVLEINNLIKSAYDDFQLISDMLEK